MCFKKKKVPYVGIGAKEYASVTRMAKEGDIIELCLDGKTYEAPLQYGRKKTPDGSWERSTLFGSVGVDVEERRLFGLIKKKVHHTYLIAIDGKIINSNAKVKK